MLNSGSIIFTLKPQGQDSHKKDDKINVINGNVVGDEVVYKGGRWNVIKDGAMH